MTTPPQNPYGQGQDPWGSPTGGQSTPPPQDGSYGQPPHGQGQLPYGQPWGSPTPPPRKNNPLVVTGALVAVLLVVGGLVFFSTRGSDGAGTAAGTTTSRSSSTMTSSSGGSTRTSAAPTTSASAGSLSVDVAVGGCVAISGSTSSPDVAPVDCGSSGSSYKVTSTAATSHECTPDSDYVYYETSRFGSTELGALCMDVDWTEGECFELGSDNPVRADCTVPGKDVERVGPILQGTADDRDCDQGGITYSERNFVVCLESVTTS